VWKVIYGECKEAYFDNPFQEDTLKDVLKKLKIGVSNEKVNEKVALQNE